MVCPQWLKRRKSSTYSDESPRANSRNNLYGRDNVEQLNLEQFKAEVHRTLIPKLDLEKLSRRSGLARQAVARMIGGYRQQHVPLSLSEQEKVCRIFSMRFWSWPVGTAAAGFADIHSC